jgi:hypothetical protein
MGIQEPELVDLAHKLEDPQQKKSAHPLSKVCNDLIFTMNVWGSSQKELILCPFLCFSLVKASRKHHGTTEKQS